LPGLKLPKQNLGLWAKTLTATCTRTMATGGSAGTTWTTSGGRWAQSQGFLSCQQSSSKHMSIKLFLKLVVLSTI